MLWEGISYTSLTHPQAAELNSMEKSMKSLMSRSSGLYNPSAAPQVCILGRDMTAWPLSVTHAAHLMESCTHSRSCALAAFSMDD